MVRMLTQLQQLLKAQGRFTTWNFIYCFFLPFADRPVSGRSVRELEQKRQALVSAGFGLETALTRARGQYEAINSGNVSQVLKEMKSLRGMLQ